MITLQSDNTAKRSSPYEKLRNNKCITLQLILLGVAIGSLLTSSFMQKRLFLSLNRRAIYEKEYYQSNFYQDSKFTKGSNPFDVETTIERLYQHFPKITEGPTGANNIMQMWKKKPEECEYGEYPNPEMYERWLAIHPNFNFTFFTNAEVDRIIKKTFINTVPEVWEAYRSLPKVILQSDFGRYLLIFLEGGLYSDIDVWPYKPIDKWMDATVDTEVNMVIGVESDPNKEEWQSIMPRRIQFLQWTFKAKKRHPALARVIAYIVKATFEAQVDSKLTAFFKDFKDNVDPCKSMNVMDWTGPGIFSDAIYGHFNKVKDLDIVYMSPYITNSKDTLYGPDAVPGVPIDWKTFTGVSDPVIVDDIMILPRRGFRADGDCNSLCYVQHRFSGSWKSGDV